MNNISPFKIEVSNEDLEDLKLRLSNTRWPDKETPDDWSQGIPLSYMKEVCMYWLNSYDWRKCETKLNTFSQFKAKFDNLDIHFIHERSKHENAKPLLITHGWPGSIVEFHKVIEPLVDPTSHGGSSEDAFHIIAPSLPGYGFSDKPNFTGWGAEKIAHTWSELMATLGYKEYFAQGGDWGALVTTEIGKQDPQHCKAIHLNMAIVTPDAESMENITEKESKALIDMGFYQEWDSGYSKQQSTRPQTLGYGLADSPLGQAAWILEKFYQWTDCSGHPENILTRDELLDNVMIYWLTNSGASSARLYWESFNNNNQDKINAPTGISVFPKEIFRASERWIHKRFTDLQYYNELEIGGHFAAFEQPGLYLQEIRNFFRNFR